MGTSLSIFSYGFIAFGPMITLFCVTIARKPHEVIVMMSAAFFWLLSLLVTSIIWIIVPPLKNQPAFSLPFSVILQEFFRWLLFRLLRKADKVLEVVSDDKTPRRKHRLAYVSGLGFGTISAVVLFSNVLRESGGPAVVGINHRGSQYFVLTAAVGTNVLLVLHICWSVLWFSGWEMLHNVGLTKSLNLQSWVQIVTVIITHMLVACLSLLIIDHSAAYFLVVSHLCAAILIFYALLTAGAKPGNIRYLFQR